ncbi:hypothetical protein [Micromonospora haikouensis]|uniref:hypothetical protein n=1 Tax=Micromonospora haikouensis TaxID=686309 RepID=UPI003D7036A5
MRDELSAVADRIAADTVVRNELVTRVRRWDADSDRAIGELAGLSHTQVRRIAEASDYVI